TDLGNKVHIFAHPDVRGKLTEFFTEILGCEIAPIPGPVTLPIVVFVFPGGASLSVEFTDDALDERQARRGAYLELKSDDPQALKRRILAEGLPEVHYFG